MPEPTTSIKDLLRVHPRLMRSIVIERDIEDPSSSLGYILTPTARDAMERIGEGFEKNSTRRAWRMTGDYGSGKSDFALALARVISGRSEELPPAFKNVHMAGRFKPALATGDSEPLGASIFKAIGKRIDGRTSYSTHNVLAAVREAVTSARKGGYAGLAIIVDELGKNLEFAARYPEESDIFLLQKLAEEAARSGEKAFVIIGILHQGISAYSSGLEPQVQREWDKVAGRYEEIVFAQPLGQITSLVASTLNVDAKRLPPAMRNSADQAMREAVKLGVYGGTVAEGELSTLGPGIFPIHPTALPVILRSMRRFGQSERSLFSFLASAEPMGLQDHCHRFSGLHGSDPFYRTSDFYEFLKRNMAGSIGSLSGLGPMWGLIEESIATVCVDQHDSVREILKVIGLLGLLNTPELPATRDVVLAASRGSKKALAAAFDQLIEQRRIFKRGVVEGYCLWPNTSVDLREEYDKAAADRTRSAPDLAILCDYIESSPLVPRSYYVRTGTLRFAPVDVVPAIQAETLTSLTPQLGGAHGDLHLTVLLPENQKERDEAIRVVEQHHTKIAHGHVVVVGNPIPGAAQFLHDLLVWEAVKKNSAKLVGDRFAREELTRQIEGAKRALRFKVNGLNNLGVRTSCKQFECFTKAGRESVQQGREMLAFTDRELEKLYPESPRVFNELVNRIKPSAAAVASRTKLAQAMAESPHLANLGMDDSKRPSELALYLSVVKNGGFHAEQSSGSWGFRFPDAPDDQCNLLPCMGAITDLLCNGDEDALVAVPDVFAILSAPPFGVREGLQPVLIAIYLATLHQRVALYEDGTYLHEVGGDTFLRLMKEPEAFHLQYSTLQGVRSEIFSKLMDALQLSPRDSEHADLIDLVRPLAIFIAKEIPEYSRKTKSLPIWVLSVRKALLESREPVSLIFQDIPLAIGVDPIGADTVLPDGAAKKLCSKLREAVHVLRNAYPVLLDNLEKAVLAAFETTADFQTARTAIADRAEQVFAAVMDPTVRAFANRLKERDMPRKEWLESLGNLLARKSPQRWTDHDEAEFHHQLEIAAARFKRTEFASVGTTTRLNGHACRIALTKSDGTEVGELIRWEGTDNDDLNLAAREIEDVMDRLGDRGLPAAMQVLWRRIERNTTPQSSSAEGKDDQ